MTATIHVGDCREVLRTLADRSVQCVITSPPYFGLRDYSTGEWDGGDPACDHRAGAQQSAQSTLAGNGHGAGKPLSPQLQAQGVPFRDVCGRCGARRVDSQIGLEASPEEYVQALVGVFREIHRVLRDDGVAFLNLGDAFGPGKQLLGMPWRVAFAVQADGWILRQEIVWAKPSAMPESVTDRCTRAHEQVFMFAKRARYFMDMDAIREDNSPVTVRVHKGYDQHAAGHKHRDEFDHRGTLGDNYGSRVLNGRNKRSVWTVSTMPFSSERLGLGETEHFAVMPPALVEPMVLAGSRPGDVVLDPFSGAGTVGVVCGWHGRDYVGIELSPAYADMSRRRIALEGRPGGRPANHEPARVNGHPSLFDEVA